MGYDQQFKKQHCLFVRFITVVTTFTNVDIVGI